MSILKHLVDDKKGIRENFAEQYFEFYVRGYTKECQGIKVQPNHALLYSDAALISTSPGGKIEKEYLYPFGQKDPLTTVSLIPEPNNKFDANALVVVAEHPYNVEEYRNGESTNTHELVLGYVPASISRIVRHNLEKLKTGYIKKVRSIHGGKHCSTKVAIPWKPEPREEDLFMMDRLADLVDTED